MCSPGIRIECFIAILRQNSYMHEQRWGWADNPFFADVAVTNTAGKSTFSVLSLPANLILSFFLSLITIQLILIMCWFANISNTDTVVGSSLIDILRVLFQQKSKPLTDLEFTCRFSGNEIWATLFYICYKWILICTDLFLLSHFLLQRFTR